MKENQQVLTLTEEQRQVVELDAGRHLVLAPPGSGKTEMLAERIFRALSKGIAPRQMLCATFTNRAAYEMRERVESEGANLELPEIGNLHHFCERFLRQEGILHPGKHVIDEGEQCDFAHEVLEVLRGELAAGEPADLKRTHGVTVLAHVRDRSPERLARMREDLETFIAKCVKNNVSAAGIAVEGISHLHRQRIGIPRQLIPPCSPSAFRLHYIGVLWPMEKACQGLKRRFLAVDFDDLLNETYLKLMRDPLPEERRFAWVQIDEVQDLNPLQWAIVRELTATQSVSVYFGDLEQAIFSFLGASLRVLEEATADCVRHYFRINFRATPLLLEILMRYSLDRLESSRTFLAYPIDAERVNGIVRMATGEEGSVFHQVKWLLRSGMAREVAVLVRTNISADALDELLSELPWRRIKVSGRELAQYRPMRDFAAFVELFTPGMSRSDWSALVRRFADGIYTKVQARYFVRSMFASGWDPLHLLDDDNPVPLLPPLAGRSRLWAWRHRSTLGSLRRLLKPVYDQTRKQMAKRMDFHWLFEAFAKLALGKERRYGVRELLPEQDAAEWSSCPIDYEEACRRARERIEKFLRYADSQECMERLDFREVLETEWPRLRRLKEADMLVGDERIVISTVHKAKGRQFDAVVVPEVYEYARNEETLRALYVAMSRAKRHLVLLQDGDSPVSNLVSCFEPGYEGYYLRKRHGGDLSGDWLFQWEQLSEMKAAGRYDRSLVQARLKSTMDCVSRMAVQALVNAPEEERRCRLLELLNGERDVDVVIKTLAEAGIFDKETSGKVHVLVPGCQQMRVGLAALAYAQMGWKLGNDMRDDFRQWFEESLYAPVGEVRSCAVEWLDRHCGTHYSDWIYGVESDFEKLGHINAPGHDALIRGILATPELPKAYETNLRNILLSRAM